MPGKRRKYTKEFKTESVEYLLKSGKPMTEVSESLGVDYWLLSKWKKAYLNEGKKAFSGKPDLSELEKENKRLKQALEDSDYAWRKRKKSKRELENEMKLKEIEKIHDDNRLSLRKREKNVLSNVY